MIKTCEFCNNEFYSKPCQHKKFCSKKCYNNWRKVKLIKECPVCGKNMKLTRHYFEEQITCSLKCSAAYRFMNNTFGHRPHALYINRICKHCGKSFKITESIYKKRQKKSSLGGCFCSVKCARTYQIENSDFGINKPTSIEIIMKNTLEYYSIKYKSQYVMGQYIVDFILPQYNIVIECDGDYWHNRPEIIKRDKRKNKFLESRGWKVLRFSETDINQNLYWCLSIIMHETGLTQII